MRIKILGLDLKARGLLVLKLSADPSEEWCRFFGERWASPTNTARSGTFRKSVFVDWEHLAPGPGPLFKTDVDDFERNYKSVVEAAVEHANNEMRRFEDKQVAKASAAADTEERDREELERERQKARAVKFEKRS